MSFGIEIFNANGSKIYSSADSSWNLIGSFNAPANTNTSFSCPVYPERIVSRLMLNQLTGDYEAYVHEYTLASNSSTLYVTAPSSTETVETQFLVFGR
jgi:hypothetical protein